MASIDEHLRMLRDVQGVHGSFVIAGGTGTLVGSDLPSAFDGEVFADVGPRVARLFETFVSGGDDVESCMLRFAEYKLYLRKMTWGLIGIISSVGVNLPALRMVVNLVMRRLDSEAAASSSPPLALTRSSAPPYPPPPYPPPPTPPLRAGHDAVARTALDPLSVRASADPRASALMPPDAPAAALPVDGRDSVPPTSDRHVRMYRGRRVDE